MPDTKCAIIQLIYLYAEGRENLYVSALRLDAHVAQPRTDRELFIKRFYEHKLVWDVVSRTSGISI